MPIRRSIPAPLAALGVAIMRAAPVGSGSVIPFTFSTGNPDGLIGTLSRPAGDLPETETADDFRLGFPATIPDKPGYDILDYQIFSITKLEDRENDDATFVYQFHCNSGCSDFSGHYRSRWDGFII